MKKPFLVFLEDIFLGGLVIGFIGLFFLIVLFGFSLLVKNNEINVIIFILIIITSLLSVFSGIFFFAINYIIMKKFPQLHNFEQKTTEMDSKYIDDDKIQKKFTGKHFDFLFYTILFLGFISMIILLLNGACSGENAFQCVI